METQQIPSAPAEQITENKAADPKQEDPKQIEIELIQALLVMWETQAKEGQNQVEETRHYIKSDESYDKEKYHILSNTWQELIISQVDEGEKYQQKITLSKDRMVALAVALLQQRLQEVQQQVRQKEACFGDDSLGDLDDHPF